MNYTEFKSNCHTHSTYCDGRNSINDMANEAFCRGFVSLGFSGHSPIPYANDWAMTNENLNRYINDINYVKQIYKNKVEILTGIELDNDSKNIDLSPFDYVINSIHTLNYQGGQIAVDTSPELWLEGVNCYFEGDMMRAVDEYFRQAYQSAIRPHGDIVGHFDLVTKFNHSHKFFDENSGEYLNLSLSALDGVCDVRPDIIFEVNTGAMPRSGKKTPYPSLHLLKRLNERGMRITVTSDCHDMRYLEIGYDISFELIKEAGFKSVWRIREYGFEEILI